MAEETVNTEEAMAEEPQDACSGAVREESSGEEEIPADAVELLREEVRSVAEERDQFKDALIHERADFENYKKRNAALEKTAFDRGTEDAVLRILPVLDNFERALGSDPAADKFAEGMQMIMRQMQEVLQGLGVTEIDSSGEFDPAVHHAVMQAEEDDVPSNYIVETLQKGYRLGEKVLRAAMVKVNK